MANNGIHSGRYGVVNFSGKPSPDTVRDWTVSHKKNVVPFCASNTFGGHGRVIGNDDWSGSCRAYGGRPVAMPGDFITFTGFTAPDNDAWGTTGKEYNGYAIIESVEVNWNWRSGESVSQVLNFAASGALSEGTSSSIIDTVAPQVATPIGLIPSWTSVTIDGSPTNFLNVVSAALKITSANKPYVNSGTNGQTNRVAGNIDWTLSLTVEENDLSHTGVALNTPYSIRLPINPGGDQWKLNWGILHDFGNLKVDRESGNIIEGTLEFSMYGFGYVNTATGFINVPTRGQWWPFPGC